MDYTVTSHRGWGVVTLPVASCCRNRVITFRLSATLTFYRLFYTRACGKMSRLNDFFCVEKEMSVSSIPQAVESLPSRPVVMSGSMA